VAEVFEVEGPEDPALEAAAEALGSGELVVLPTDTVYGVAGRPDLPGATGRIFEVKRRPPELTLPVLVAGTSDARRVASLGADAERLADRFWPGGLTLVLPRTEWSGPWDLGGEGGTVGVRVPAHEVALELLARTGPLAATSANRSGHPTPSDCPGVRAALGDQVAVYLCAGSAASGVASTVVDLTAGEPRILREGAIPPDDVLTALAV
jgi:tRNA threonylcarbamoyl adenosine modification protein (Sua5/YciO/YrdC/YwlC family)